MRTTPRFVAGIVAGLLLLGSTTQWTPSTSAASGAPRLAFAAGQVSNLLGSAFTLTRTVKKTGQTVNLAVTVAPNAKEKSRQGTSGALANGDFAVVVGSRTSSGITASKVLYSTTAFKLRRHVRHIAIGTDVSSSATSLVIKTKQGKDVTFTITPGTRYRVAGKLVAAEPPFTSGERLAIRFKRDEATRTLIALAVRTPNSV